MTKVDAKIRDTREGGDLSLKGNDVELTGGWFNFVYLALFGGNVEQQTPQERNPEELAEDFWGNSLFHPESPALQFNSRTEKVLNETQLNSQGRAKIEDAVKSDLEFMSQFANIGVSVNIESFSRVGIEISIQEPGNLEDKQFRFIWDQAKRELEGVKDEKEPEIEYQDYQVTGGSTGTGVSLSGYQTYTFTFEANSSKYNAQTIECNGTIQQVDSPVGYTLKKATNSSPYEQSLSVGDSVEKGDFVWVELNSIPTSEVKVELVNSYSDESYSTVIPEDFGGKGTHAYVANVQDNSVSILNKNSKTIQTITLSFRPIAVVYRHINKSIYLFGDGDYYAIIDADNNSANFNTLLKEVSITFSSIRTATYDFNKDLFLLTRNTTQIFNPNTESFFEIGYGGNGKHSRYLLGVGTTYHVRLSNLQLYAKEIADNTIPDIQAIPTGLTPILNYKTGLLYSPDTPGCIVRSLENFKQIASINSYNNRRGGGCAIANSLVFFGPNNIDDIVSIIDASTNTAFGTFQIPFDTNEIGIQTMLYSRQLDRILFVTKNKSDPGGRNIYILNPYNSVSNMHESKHQVGRNASDYNTTMAFNELEIAGQIDW